MIKEILEVCKRINHNRTMMSVHDHANSEMYELLEEIMNVDKGLPEGSDGVVGEAVDVILCMVDVIYKRDPNITEEQILKVALKKLAKWERVYGKEGKV